MMISDRCGWEMGLAVGYINRDVYRAVQVLSVSRVGECINVEVGTEEDMVFAVPNEVGQMM